ncbi:MAG: hypothetical protein R3359_01430, partial [Marinirhabdus sp.]|nr:hypothetical protein [Marinirhabdus sp.]
RKYTDVGQNRYANYLSDVSLLNVSNITDENFDDINEPIKLSYDYEQSDYIEEIAGDLYLQPLLHFGVTENIFKEEDRLYPVDISHPYGYKFIITYNIPEGYAVSSLPESRLVKMEENIGYLKFDTLQRGNTIQVSFTFDIKHHLIPANYYPALKALYGEYVKISNSKIVLQKTI